MERLALADIDQRSAEEARGIIYQLARDYSPLIDLDFDKDVLPKLNDPEFWDVDYMPDSKWGLSLMDSYRCLVDVHRTTQIMRGIAETVKSLRAAGKDEIYAIDAGTGTGVFAVYLASLGVQKVFALELNEITAERAGKFIEIYGLSSKIEIVVGDATQMDIQELRARPADLLISENLSGGLFAEPQFQIINHLSKFLNPEAPIVPCKADISASLGHGDWEKINWNGKPPRNVIAKRRIPNVVEYTARMPYASVSSERGMDVPEITGNLTLETDIGASVNTLLISTTFQINKSGKIYKLEPDSAEFLGKTTAIRLPEEVFPYNGQFELMLNYEAGFSVKNNPDSVRVAGNRIMLEGNKV